MAYYQCLSPPPTAPPVPVQSRLQPNQIEADEIKWAKIRELEEKVRYLEELLSNLEENEAKNQPSSSIPSTTADLSLVASSTAKPSVTQVQFNDEEPVPPATPPSEDLPPSSPSNTEETAVHIAADKDQGIAYNLLFFVL